MRFLRLLSAFAALSLFAGIADAQTPQFSPRQFQTQQTHYLRIDVKYNSINGRPCVLVSNACTVKVGAVPYNAYIVRGYQQIITNFNSGSTDTLAIGTSSASANELVAAQSVHSGAGNQSSLTIASSGSGIQVTGNGTTPTGANGGYDIYVKYAQTSTAPTAGEAVIILEYFAPNDGTCAPVALGSTATAC